MGVQLPLGEYGGLSLFPTQAGTTVEFVRMPKLGQIAFPINRLYDRGRTLLPSKLLAQRIDEPYIHINLHDAGRSTGKRWRHGTAVYRFSRLAF